MKIVEAISDTNIGGAGVLLLTRLTGGKYALDTTVLIPKTSLLKKKLQLNKINYIETNGCRDRSFDILAIFEYIKILKKLSPQVVNCHGCLSCRIAAMLCGVPVRLYTKHCVFPIKRYQRNFVYRKLYGMVQGILSNHIIAVADAAKKELIELGVRDSDVTVIINGANAIKKLSEKEQKRVRCRLNIPEDAIVISIFARLEGYKGHDDFLYAAKELLKKSKKFRFLIVGGGSRMETLVELSKELNISEYVFFTGFVDDVSELFNITDINVNCSYGTETSSLAISEGMSLGIPCVASNFGGNTHMVKNGKNGFIYPARDYISLANKIVLLSMSKALYERISNNCIDRYSSEFSSERMTEQTYGLYQHMLSKSRNLYGSF